MPSPQGYSWKESEKVKQLGSQICTLPPEAAKQAEMQRCKESLEVWELDYLVQTSVSVADTVNNE